MGKITTHVLDTSRGVPARGVGIELHRIEGDERLPVSSALTNADGRTDGPLMSGDGLDTGIYELTFHVEDYFTRAGVKFTDPPFFGEIVIRFGVADAAANYHVPLLLSPYGYSTYRGS